MHRARSRYMHVLTSPCTSSRVLQKYKMYCEHAGTFKSAMTLDLAQRGSSGGACSGHLCVDELDDIGVAAQSLQQSDLVDEPGRRLVVAPRQPDALQRIYLPARRHHLQPSITVTDDCRFMPMCFAPFKVDFCYGDFCLKTSRKFS
jgi:hypothetical protein